MNVGEEDGRRDFPAREVRSCSHLGFEFRPNRASNIVCQGGLVIVAILFGNRDGDGYSGGLRLPCRDLQYIHVLLTVSSTHNFFFLFFLSILEFRRPSRSVRHSVLPSPHRRRC